jgi:hypothetical protein
MPEIQPILHPGLSPEERARKAKLITDFLAAQTQIATNISQSLRATAQLGEQLESGISHTKELLGQVPTQHRFIPPEIIAATSLRAMSERIIELARGAPPEGPVEQWLTRKR